MPASPFAYSSCTRLRRVCIGTGTRTPPKPGMFAPMGAISQRPMSRSSIPSGSASSRRSAVRLGFCAAHAATTGDSLANRSALNPGRATSALIVS